MKKDQDEAEVVEEEEVVAAEVAEEEEEGKYHCILKGGMKGWKEIFGGR